MTKRTNQTKLTLYRRHASTCPVTESKTLDQCECPIWTHGKVRGKFIRTSLDTRSIETALRKKDDLINGTDDDDPNGGLHVVKKSVPKGNETLEFAGAEFLKSSNNRSVNSTRLYRRAVLNFTEWASKHNLVYLREIESSHIRLYFEECGRNWKKTSAQTNLTYLRVWFNYCARTRRWIPFPPTEDRNLNHRARSSKVSRVPFTPAEITRVLSAVEEMPEKDRDITRALVLLMLYTGMRISDATFFERSYITERNTADYFVIKTRKQISLPPEVQKPALEALKKLPATRVYFFQSDRDDDYRDARSRLREGEEFSQFMPQYLNRVQIMTKYIRRLLDHAGLEGACHRFRDTFAVNLLVQGTDIFTVSQMLGHSDVKITAQHYMKLIPGYREKMSQATRNLAYEFPKAS